MNNTFEINEALLTTEDNLRYRSAKWFDEAANINLLVLGLGGIGSNLAWQLLKTGPNAMTLVDMDRVEAVNMAGQFFPYSAISKNKADEVATWLNQFNHKTSIYPLVVEVDHTMLTLLFSGIDVIFTGFDNMEARKNVWEEFKEKAKYNSRVLLVDGRCSATDFHIYAIPSDDPDKMKRYEEELFTDEEADETVCSFKQTAYISNMVASFMVHTYINWLTTISGGFAVLPFKQEFNSFTSDYKTIM